MIYLTYNEAPTGIFLSQVCDVCNFLNKEFNVKIKLVSLISIRRFARNRRKIKSEYPYSIVLPMFPRIRNWRLNYFQLFILFLFLNGKKVIARGPFATSLALLLKRTGTVKWVCFDGRGASTAEQKEYHVIKDNVIASQISRIERHALLKSDFRISISNTLVNYWKAEFKYHDNSYEVIPCTFHTKYFKTLPEESQILEKRRLLGFSQQDIIFAFAGSSAQWQSLQLIDDFFFIQMKNNPLIKILFLLPELPSTMRIVSEFNQRVFSLWVKESEMQTMLSICDYGLLLREKNITNLVASPVKFAEYLVSGLNVIISEDIGDLSDFVRENKCGTVVSNDNFIPSKFNPLSYLEKQKNHSLALRYLSKAGFKNSYNKLIS